MSRSTRTIFIVFEVLLAVGIVARLTVAEPTHARAERPSDTGREAPASEGAGDVPGTAEASGEAAGQAAAETSDPAGETRLLLAGDSILRQTGPALDDRFGEDVIVMNEGVNGSGLLTPGTLDWVEHLRQLVAEKDPDVVVFLFVGNYTDNPADYWIAGDGQPVPHNTLAFFAAWAEQADRLMEIAESTDTEVYWVLPPPEYTELNRQITTGLRQVYSDLALRWPSIHLIDANAALAGPAGEYLASTTDQSGVVVPLRATDTVHLTEAGASRLAGTIFEQIDPNL